MSALKGFQGAFRVMIKPQLEGELAPIECAIALAEAALRLCDAQGYLFAAIDLSSALDKLQALKAIDERH